MDDWIKAGKIASQAREFSASLIKENAKILDIIEKIEDFILDRAELGFPTQLSINEKAAHQTAFPNEETKLKKGDLVKVDLGVSVNGCIGDTAKTFEISTNKYKDLIESTEKALNEAIKICRPNIKISEIGKTIEKTISSYGFNSIKNLTGHSIEKYSLHSGVSIPNFNNNSDKKIEKGTIIAIEPFSTPGIGLVKEGKPSSIYKINKIRNIRDKNSREIIKYVSEKYKTLPFSKRDLIKKFNPVLVNLSLNNLERQGIFYQYPLLIEKSKSPVAQTEHTILIDDEIKVLTK